MSLATAIEKKIAVRLAACRDSGHLVLVALRDAGVRASTFGSTARGDVHPASDLDILVLDRGLLSRGRILDIAEGISTVPVDVLFAEDLTPTTIRSIQEDMNHVD